jgi:predicted ATPase
LTGHLLPERSFVFTDIELSSSHWHHDESVMSQVLPLHNELITEAFVRWGGKVLRGEGDSCAALFASPVEALEASGDLQRRLSTTEWPIALRVRVGIHSGRVYHLYGSEYGGTPLNYLGRLHKAGHGGQILVSDLTASDLEGRLPSPWSLVDLGQYVLKDFPRRTIYQAVHPDLPRHFPPLSALRPIHGRDLPDNVFVGRSREIAEIAALLTGGCTTVTGPGGVGKTRLAFEIAQRVRERYRDGVCIVELAGVESADHVAPAVANALQIDPQLESAVDLSILRSLRGRSLLVILDNCEHLGTVGELAMTMCSVSGVDVLATSRTPLGVRHERVYPLQPLPAPSPTPSAREAALSDAVQLFVDRVRVVRSGFDLDPVSTGHVAEICRSVAGIPLSIELAAAAARTIPLDVLATELRSGGALPATLAEGARARAAIDWSLDSLGPEETAVLRALAVFPGGASADLVAAVVPGPARERRRLLAALDVLVQRSLVQLEDSSAGGHFRLLEPLRLAALEPVGSIDRGDLEARHADVVSALALAAESRLQSDAEAAAVDDLDRLFASLRACVQRDLDLDPDRAARVLMATQDYCLLRMRYEMNGWTEALLQRSDLEPATEATLCALSGLVSFNRGELEATKDVVSRGIALAAKAGRAPHVYTHFALMAAHGLGGDYARAETHFRAALTWCSDNDSDYFLVNTLVLAAMSMTIQGQQAVGLNLARSALDVGERIANPSCIAWALCAAADAERLTSPGAAHVHIEDALSTARSVRARWVEAEALLDLAKLCWHSDVEEAAVALIGAITAAEQTGHPIHGRVGMRIAALLLAGLGRDRDATLLLDPTTRNASALPLAPDVAEGLDEVRRSCATRLGADVFDAYIGRGRRMPDRELLAHARSALNDAVSA